MRKVMTLEKLEQIMELRLQHYPVWEISNKLGISSRIVANYTRTVHRLQIGMDKLKSDHVNMEIINAYMEKHTEGEVNQMERGTKMTAKEVERIAIMTGTGKSESEIAKEINRAQSTVSAYVTAIRQAANGTFVHQSGSGVRADLIEPYRRKEGKEKEAEQELMEKEVRKENRKETVDADGHIILNPENALLIANEIEAKTPTDIISRLMRVDIATINKVMAYIKVLRDRENDKAVSWRKSGVLQPEVFDALEVKYGFVPHERTEKDIEEDWRKQVLSNQEFTNDLLNSIDDLLRKLIKILEPGNSEQIA